MKYDMNEFSKYSLKAQHTKMPKDDTPKKGKPEGKKRKKDYSQERERKYGEY